MTAILTAVQVSTGTSAHLFSAIGFDNSWSHRKFERNFRVAMKWVKGNDMQFDLIGIDPAIANALRRILIAEIPTMAIEHVYIINNTSIIAVRTSHWMCCSSSQYMLLAGVLVIGLLSCSCSVRCSRIGWAWCQYKWIRTCSMTNQVGPATAPYFIDNSMTSTWTEACLLLKLLVPVSLLKGLADAFPGDETATETNTVVFRLNVRCRREGDATVNEKGKTNPASVLFTLSPS